MPDFFNLINAKIERSSQNAREKERQTENLQSLFTQEEIQSPTVKPVAQRINLDSIMIGNDDSHEKPLTPSAPDLSPLSVEIGTDAEDKDYFKEINKFDYLSLESLPLKAQNRALRTEYLEVRSKLKDFNEEMKQLIRKQRSLFIDVEKSKKETHLMRNVIRSIANLLPNGSELKSRLDTTDWNITDVEQPLLQHLQTVITRVRNAEQYVTDQLKTMTEEVEKYKKALNLMHNEKQTLQQELQTSFQTVTELQQMVESLKHQVKRLEEEKQQIQAQVHTAPVISEEERIRQEKLRLLQEKQRELELIQRQLEELNPFSTPTPTPNPTTPAEPTITPVSIQPTTIPISIKKPKTQQPEPIQAPETQTEVETKAEILETPEEDFSAVSRYESLFAQQSSDTTPETPSTAKPQLDINVKRIDVEVRHPFKQSSDKKPNQTVDKTKENPAPAELNSFDIDSFLQEKLQPKTETPSIPKTDPSHTPTAEITQNVEIPSETDSSQDEIIIPINIEEHIQSLNDKRLFVLKAIGKYGYSRNQELSDFIQEDAEGLEVFGGKGKNIKQETTNITRGLIDSTYLSASRITMGGRGGHNFNAFELTNIGKAIYKHLTKQQPVISEMSQLKKHHGSYEHGYLIKESSDRFRELGYTVYTDLDSCRYDLPDGSGFKRFDFVIEKDGEKQLIEVERGTHNEEDFFHMCDKIFAITKQFYFITPNQTVLYDKTRKYFHLWIKKRMGGSSDPRIKGQVTVNLLSFDTLTKTPLPKQLWKTTKF